MLFGQPVFARHYDDDDDDVRFSGADCLAATREQLCVGGPVCVEHKTPEAIKILLWHRFSCSSQSPSPRSSLSGEYNETYLTPRNSIQPYSCVPPWSVQQERRRTSDSYKNKLTVECEELCAYVYTSACVRVWRTVCVIPFIVLIYACRTRTMIRVGRPLWGNRTTKVCRMHLEKG